MASKVPAHWKALLICPDRAAASELQPLLKSHLAATPVLELKAYPRPSELAEAVQSFGPSVCFLDVSSNPEAAFQILADLLGFDSSISVVGLLSANAPDLILRCLRQGASEFLLRPFGEDQLLPVLDRLLVMKGTGAPERAAGKVIAIIPAKGACGATTIACSLAFQGKLLGAKKVLLADLDPIAGTLSFLLKLKSTYSFIDALARGSTLDEDLWKGMVVANHGADVLLSPESPIHGVDESYSPETIVSFARQHYDAVVLDTGGVYGEWSLQIAQLCDQILLVSTNELAAVQSAQRALTYLDRGRIDRSKLHLVVNRYNPDAGMSRQVIETALHTEIFHELPSDYDQIHRALVDGKPVNGSGRFSRELAALAGKLRGDEAAEEQAQVDKTNPRKGSALASLLSLFSRGK